MKHESAAPAAPAVARPEEVTRLLRDWREGDRGALERLMPLVYAELRRLADRHLRHERPDHTLQATALVHEAYLRLAGAARPRWRDRVHFFAVAAQLMRRILVDHARAHRAAKRGGGALRVPLEDAAAAVPAADLVELDEALTALAAVDPRKSRIVELHHFAGLSVAETAALLGVSTSTVVLEGRLARAWLVHHLRPGNGAGEPPAGSRPAP